jgi:hypothetical protein
MNSRYLFLTLFALLLSGPVSAEPNANICIVGQWIGGPCHAVAAAGPIAYLGNGPRLEIVDFTDPAYPEHIDDFALTTPITEIAKQGEHLYVLCEDEGLQIYDVFGPHEPYRVSALEIEGVLTNINIDGHYAYITVRDEGLCIVDVSDPANPVQFAFIDTAFATESIVVRNNLAYVTRRSNGLSIIDISDPTSPFTVGTFPDPGLSFYSLALYGNYAIVNGYNSYSDADHICIIDVSDPTTPALVTTTYISGRAVCLEIRDTALYVSTSGNSQGRFYIFDLSDPQNLVQIGVASTLDWASDIAISDYWAFVSTADAGLTVFNISGPSIPSEVGLYPTGVGAYWSVANNRYLYTTGSGFSIFDIANPQAPQLVSNTYIADPILDVAIGDNHLYYVDWYGVLGIYDVSDPAAPIQVNEIDIGDHDQGIAIKDDYAFLGGISGLLVLDISDPGSPQQVWEADPSPGTAHSVFIEGDYAYLPGHCFVIYDISTPTNPVQVSYMPSDCQSNMAINGDYAFITTVYGHIAVVDISDRSAPVAIYEHSVGAFAMQIRIADNLAFVVCSNSGLKVLDISDPLNISQCGYFETPAVDLILQNDQMYLTAGSTGFWVLRYDPLAAAPDQQFQTGSFFASPNPFNPTTNISYTLDRPGEVDLRIFDASGRLIRTLIAADLLDAGRHETRWSGRDDNDRAVETGVYFARLKTSTTMTTRRITLSR